MIRITQDIYMFENLKGANAFLLILKNGLALIDTGMKNDLNNIISQITDAGYNLSDLKSIILTHCHCDHTGCAADLVRRSGAQVLAHKDEVKYIT